MKFAATAAVLAGSLALAAPIAAPISKRATNVTDTDILQYALTLEHLEDYFYHHYLGMYSQSDFAAAGYPAWVRNRIEEIAGHEANHVALLSGALGSAAVAACNYTFPVTDVQSFIGLAVVVENVGVSAYLGAASSIMEAAYVTVAGSILTTEARHQSWLSSSVSMNQPWSGPEDTPLDFNEVYSIVTPFFTSCPSSNAALPFMAFPALSIGSDGTITTTANMTGDCYLQVISGLDSNTFPVMNGMVQNAPMPQGISYAVLTSEANSTMVSDDNILAGPAIIVDNFPSQAQNPAPSF